MFIINSIRKFNRDNSLVKKKVIYTGVRHLKYDNYIYYVRFPLNLVESTSLLLSLPNWRPADPAVFRVLVAVFILVGVLDFETPTKRF